MTVPSTAQTAGPFNGNGVTTAFPFTFKCFDRTHLQWVVATDGVESTKVLDSDYSVTLNPDQDALPGGTITYPISGTPLPLGSTATLTGAVPLGQTVDLPDGGRFNASDVERMGDLLALQNVQTRDLANRALKLPVTAVGADPTLPVPVPGNVIGWDEAGEALRNIDPTTLASIVSYANWRTLVGPGGVISYTLAADPGNVNNTRVAVSGVMQTPGVDYTLSGVTLTPTTPWPGGAGAVTIVYGEALPQNGALDALALFSGAALVGFRARVGAAVRTLESKAREVLTMRDLGALADGSDDGARITAKLYEWFSGLATIQIPYFVEIHGIPGDTYTLNTPIVIRQRRLRFIGHKAKLNCVGAAYGFDITQDGSANWPEQCLIDDWEIAGATTAGIRSRAAVRNRYCNNYIHDGGIGIDANGVGVEIVDNYLDTHTGVGILVQSAVVVGGGVGEAQGCKITGNTVYRSGTWALHIIEGGGHEISGENDFEASGVGELWLQSTFGNKVIGLYAEPDGAFVRTIIKQDNTLGLVTPPGSRISEGNQIIGGTFGGSAPGSWDIDLQAGNNTVVLGVRPGNGTIQVDVACQNTSLLPMAGTFVVTNNSSSTVDMTSPTRFWTGIKPASSTSTPLRNIGGFVDFGAADTSKTVTFSTNEDDGAYRVNLTAATISGAPAAASKRVSLSGLPGVTGFTIVNEGAPGVGTSVRVYYELMR